MKDFQKTDWKLYNRPPFWQQWLVRNDTLRLAAFGDKGLAEIDDQILALKDQWDLDHAQGHFLDRAGKLLAEPRNGNSDEFYRQLLKLRTMLNTTNGTISDVIKVIKFLYGSEIVHIVPNYPAGLTILHEGEGPNVNFNAIIRQVVGAGIDYSTKELFYFTEELPSSETVSKMKLAMSMTDYMAYVFRDRTYRRNGQLQSRYTGVKDVLSIKIGMPFLDQLLGISLQGGFISDVATETWSFGGRMDYLENIQATETWSFGGWMDYLENIQATETWSFGGRMDYLESIQATETASLTVEHSMHDTFYKIIRRNGLTRRNGAHNRAQNVVDVQKLYVHVGSLVDTIGDCTETITIRYRKHYFHNGRFHRNGAIQHDSNILFPLE
jgi:hypothetical protein